MHRRGGFRSGGGRLGGLIDTFAQGLTCVRDWRTVAHAAVLTMAAWGAWVLGAQLIFRSVDIHVSLAGVLFVCAVVGLGSAIPSAPGFVGTYHWLLTAALTLQGVDKSSALAAAVLVHAAWFLPTTLVGIVFALRRGVDLMAVRRQAAAHVDAGGSPAVPKGL